MFRSNMRLVAGLLLCLAAVAHAQEFSGPGPCTTQVANMEVQLPKDYICKCQCAVKLIITYPAEACTLAGPYPMVIFSSGFQATSGNYKPYAQRLATWGFATLQYDFMRLSPWIDQLCHSDAAEAGFMLKFIEQLQAVAENPTNPLHGKIAWDNLGAAGHSRGAKIAAMHFAGTTPNVRAAYLVDPVDGFAMTKSMLGYPSAVKLLRDRSMKLGITGAGKIAMCNGAPFATGNWTNYWEVSAPGSELQVVMNAGHLQFADVAGAWDGVCCTGCTNLLAKEEGMELALTPMVAWFQKELRGLNPTVSLADQPGFHEWVCAQEAAKKLHYVVRARGPICSGWVPQEGLLNLESGSLMVEDDGAKRTPVFHLDSTVTKPVHETKVTPLLHLESNFHGRK